RAWLVRPGHRHGTGAAPGPDRHPGRRQRRPSSPRRNGRPYAREGSPKGRGGAPAVGRPGRGRSPGRQGSGRQPDEVEALGRWVEMTPAVALAWCRFQPRTRALAGALGGEAHFVAPGPAGGWRASLLLRYLRSAVATWRLLERGRPAGLLAMRPPGLAPVVALARCRPRPLL